MKMQTNLALLQLLRNRWRRKRVVYYFLQFSFSSYHLKLKLPLRGKCPNTDFFLARIFLYSVRIQENTDQKKLRIWTLFTQCLEDFNFATRNKDLAGKNILNVLKLHLFWGEFQTQCSDKIVLIKNINLD